MPNSTKILIVEDEYLDYERISKNLRDYEYYPQTKEEFDAFLMHLRGWLERISNQREDEAEAYFKTYFENKDFQAIILDVKLGRERTDKSGLQFLQFLRGRYYTLTPIIMLSSLPASSVKDGLTSSSGMANYYLHKGSKEGRLSREFFDNQLKPVLGMLITWHKMTTHEHIVTSMLDKYTEEVIEHLDSRFGMVENRLDLLKSSVDDLEDFAKVNLGILRYHVKIDNKKAGKLADKLIEEFELAEAVPNLEVHRKRISELFGNARDEIIKAIKGETKKELTECLQDLVRDGLCIDENDPIIWEMLFTLCNFMRKNLKLYMLW